MKQIHIITPVKDSIELTLQTIESVLASQCQVPIHYTVYNDFSTPANSARLAEAATRLGFELVNLSALSALSSPERW